MRFDAEGLSHVLTVSFAGTTFALGQTPRDGAGYDIAYTYLKPPADEAREGDGPPTGAEVEESWTSPAVLDFPTQVRRVGMALLTEPVFHPDTGAPATSAVLGVAVGFSVVTDGADLWVFRNAADSHSLLADRYRFDAASGRLVKGADVRFVYSGHADLPADDKDRYGATDPIGDDFVEPTFRLALNCAIASQPCAVVLAPNATTTDAGRWNIFVAYGSGRGILRYTIPRTSRAAFDLTGEDGAVNQELQIVHADYIQDSDLCYAHPTASLYEQQELAFTAVGEPQLVQRALRCLLVCQSTSFSDPSAPPKLASFDMALGLDGAAAQIGNHVTPQRIQDYQTALAFDGRGDHVSLAEGQSIIVNHASIFFSVWIKWAGPNAERTPQTILSFNAPGATGPSAIALCISEKNRLYLSGFELELTGRSASQVSLIPNQWINVGVSLQSTGSQTNAKIYVNGVEQGLWLKDGSAPSELSFTLGQQFSNVSNPASGYDFFGGAMGQVFAVRATVDSATLPNDWVYSTSPADFSPTTPDIFWSFGEGRGTTLTDQMGYGRNGEVKGATWVPTICPDQSTMPSVYIDENFLDVRAAIIDPEDANSSAPSLKADRRVSLMRGADGYVHVYFQQDDDRAGALHLTTEVQRARFIVSQAIEGENVSFMQSGDVMALVARQAGTVWGQTDIAFGAITDNCFDDITFTSRVFPNISETWRKVPTRLDLFAQVLNGAAAQPGGAGAVTSEMGLAQYDYVANLTATDPATGAARQITGPTASAFFEVIIPQKLLEQSPVYSLKPVDSVDITANVGNDPGWVMAPLSPSLMLSGTSGPTLTTPLAPNLDIDGDLTLQCWIRRTEDDAGAVATWEGDLASYQLSLSESGEVAATRTGFNAAEMAGVARRSVTRLPKDEWAHLAAVYNSSYALHMPPGVYVKCAPTGDFNLPDAFTIETWVKLDPEAAGRSALVSRKSDDPGESAYELSVETVSGDQRILRLDMWPEGAPPVSCTKQFTCAANEWTHVAGVFETDRTLKFLSFQDDRHNHIKIGQPTPTALSTFTVEMLLRPRDSAKQTFVSYDRDGKGDADTVNYFQIGYLARGSDDDRRLAIEIEDKPIAISTATWDPDDVKWRHLSVVVETDRDHEKTFVTVYVDGEIAELQTGGAASRVEAETALSPGDATDFHSWTIGADWDADGDRGDYPDMDMNEFRLWSTARSQTEVLNALRAPIVGNESGLARYIRFDADKGSHVRYVVDQVSGQSFPIYTHDEDDYDFDDEVVIWGAETFPGAAHLFINGDYVSSHGMEGRTIAETSTPLTMGRTSTPRPGAAASTLRGSLDEVRIWSAARTVAQIDFFRLNAVPEVEKQPKLVSYWRFDDPRGATVPDIAGGHGGTIKGREFAQEMDRQALWEPSVFGADWTIYIDGAKVEMAPRAIQPPPDPPIDPDGVLHVGFGRGEYNDCINAALSELQIWSKARSQEEIAATRHQPLTPMDDLRGYYRLNDGSGARATDYSGFGRDAVIAFAADGEDPDDAWVAYDDGTGRIDAPVPIRDESLAIVNATNGYAYDEAAAIHLSEAPSAVEDFAAGRRVYAYCGSEAEGAELVGDTPLAETETVYLGQVQYKPQLVGYIEGAPPVPSENLTIDAPSNPDRYLNNSSTSLSRAKGLSVTVSDAFSFGVDIDTKHGGGLVEEAGLAKAEGGWVGTMPAGAAGGGAEDQNIASIVKGKGAVTLSEDIDGGGALETSGSTDFSASTSLIYSASLDGGWENNCYRIAGPVPNAYKIAGERLYRPNNMGSAMVKSRTADMFAVRSKRTKAMIGYNLSVNPEVPEDINIINFKLNPLYVRNGTLDGHIGFAKDEAYLDLPNGKKGSYYKPEQAYRMKSTIEREVKKLASNSDAVGALNGASSGFRISLANTYVWTADAGTFAEEESAAATFSETFSGGIHGSYRLGVDFEGELTMGVGILTGANVAADLGLNMELNLNYSSTEGETNALTLTSTVNSEGFLNRVANFPDFVTDLDDQAAISTLNSGAVPIDPGDPIYGAMAAEGLTLTVMNRVETVETNAVWRITDLYFIYEVACKGAIGEFTFTYQPTGTANSQYAVNYDYAAPPCPGKVRGYRFMSLYLASHTDNFDTFFATGDDQIIDPDWLASDDPDAVALRQAERRPNAVWRLLHRVTYVNRVPPQPGDWGEAQTATPPSQDVAAPPLRPDDHSIHHNATLIDRVLSRLAEETEDPSWTELDLHEVELENVDMRIVVEELNAVLDTLGFQDGAAREAYLLDMTTFFELLFMPNEREAA